MKCIFFFFVVMVVFVSTSFAEEPTLQQQIVNHAFASEEENFLTLTVENDMFGSGSDNNYTSGVRLSYFDTGNKPKPIIEWFEDLYPNLPTNETSSVHFSLGHNLYTPENISQPQHQPNDRPWAAFLYTSMGMTTVIDNHVDDAELTVGVVGPLAQGEVVQKTVHKIVKSPDPKGWDNQLENELGVVLSWRRRWPTAWKADLEDLSLSFEPNISASVGNVYTHIESGITARLAPTYARWQDTPILVKPSVPGSGYFQAHDKRFGWYLFGNLQGRGVLRNIFLDGNTFASSHSVKKKNAVLDATAGVAFTYKNMRLSYTTVYRTKEFYGQKDASLFGGVSVGYKF